MSLWGMGILWAIGKPYLKHFGEGDWELCAGGGFIRGGSLGGVYFKKKLKQEQGEAREAGVLDETPLSKIHLA